MYFQILPPYDDIVFLWCTQFLLHSEYRGKHTSTYRTYNFSEISPERSSTKEKKKGSKKDAASDHGSLKKEKMAEKEYKKALLAAGQF